MNESTYGSATLIKAARAAAEVFLAALEDGAADEPAVSPKGELIEYDPLTDPVPLPLDPKGTLREQQMSHLTYLGAVARINASEGRGATSKEITKYAKKAEYVDGRVVNGWNSRKGSPRAIENVDGARYLNVSAHEWLSELAADLGIKITGDIAPLPIPEQ